MKRRWETWRSVVLTEGELNPEALSNLTKQSVRWIGSGPQGQQALQQYWFVECEELWQAYSDAAERLDELLRPYSVEYFVYQAETKAARGF